jgi:hypothetical protein
MILPGQMPFDHRALQYHEAAEVLQVPSLPFVAEPGPADHFRQIPDSAILSTTNMFGCSRESADPCESLDPDELDQLMATLEPFATLLLAAQDWGEVSLVVESAR